MLLKLVAGVVIVAALFGGLLVYLKRKAVSDAVFNLPEPDFSEREPTMLDPYPIGQYIDGSAGLEVTGDRVIHIDDYKGRS